MMAEKVARTIRDTTSDGNVLFYFKLAKLSCLKHLFNGSLFERKNMSVSAHILYKMVRSDTWNTRGNKRKTGSWNNYANFPLFICPFCKESCLLGQVISFNPQKHWVSQLKTKHTLIKGKKSSATEPVITKALQTIQKFACGLAVNSLIFYWRNENFLTFSRLHLSLQL